MRVFRTAKAPPKIRRTTDSPSTLASKLETELDELDPVQQAEQSLIKTAARLVDLISEMDSHERAELWRLLGTRTWPDVGNFVSGLKSSGKKKILSEMYDCISAHLSLKKGREVK